MTDKHRKDVVPDAPQGAATTGPLDGGKGAESLRRAADRILKNQCDAIAEALAKSSIGGHIQSARFLYLLAEGQDKLEAAKVVETLHSLAIELSMEPEWPDEEEDSATDAAEDKREPQD